MSIETRTHTALHIVKGAVQKVLGVKWTTGVYQKENYGRLTVQFDRKPTKEEIQRILDLANNKVVADDLIEIYNLSREEAEILWGDNIYDIFPLPNNIKKITIFHLPEWNVNACNKEHTNSTSQVGPIKITKTRFRASKKLLEISFEIEN